MGIECVHVVEHEIISFYDLEEVGFFLCLKFIILFWTTVSAWYLRFQGRLFKSGEFVCPAVLCIFIKPAM